MKRAELRIAQIQGAHEEDGIWRVTIATPHRDLIAQFEITGGDLMKALAGRLTVVELIEGRGR